MKTRDYDEFVHMPGFPTTVQKRGATRFSIKDPYFHAVTTSWPQFFLTAFGSVTIFLIVFALLYLLQPGAVTQLPPGSFLYAYFFSVETLATVGYGEMSPASTYGHTVAAVEIGFGLILTAILTGLLFVRFSLPKPSFRFAAQALIAPQGSHSILMVRMANARLSLLTNAHARMVMLLSESTSEGHVTRRFHELELVHKEVPVFPLMWTVMQRITDVSPLAALDQAGLKDAGAQLFITVAARDAALSVDLHDIQSYDCERIVFGQVYVKAVELGQDNNLTADLGKLSNTRPYDGTSDNTEFT